MLNIPKQLTYTLITCRKTKQKNHIKELLENVNCRQYLVPERQNKEYTKWCKYRKENSNNDKFIENIREQQQKNEIENMKYALKAMEK